MVTAQCLLLRKGKGTKRVNKNKNKTCSLPDRVVTVMRETGHVEIKGKQESRSLCNLSQMGGVIIIIELREGVISIE